MNNSELIHTTSVKHAFTITIRLLLTVHDMYYALLYYDNARWKTTRI
jgi:hypothetical protein